MPGTLKYKLDEAGEWKSVKLDLTKDSVEIPDTDPCQEYQLKIKINDDDDERTLPIFGTYKSNEASITHKIEMTNEEKYYEKNFKPKFSADNKNELKISWADFCFPTTVNIYNADGFKEVCTNVDLECIIPSEPCTHYGFWFKVDSKVISNHNMEEQYTVTTPPSEAQLNSAFGQSQQDGKNLQWSLSQELNGCIGTELDYTLSFEDGTEIAKKVGVSYDQDNQIDVTIENECGATLELNVEYTVQEFDGNFNKSFQKEFLRTAVPVPTSLVVSGSEIIVEKDVCLADADLTMKMEPD